MNQLNIAVALGGLLVLASGCYTIKPISELHVLVIKGDLAALQARVQAGTSIETTDGYGRSLLYLAALQGNASIVDFLLEAGANPNRLAPSKGNDTPLHISAARGQWAVVEKMLAYKGKVNVRNKSGQTPLHFAAWSGRLRTVQSLLRAGGDPKAVDSDGLSTLHYQRDWLDPQRYQSAAEPSDIRAVMAVLLKVGAPINAAASRTWNRHTPLMAACADAPSEVVALLLDNGADSTSRTERGEEGVTAFEIAQARKRTEIVELLKARGVVR